MVKTEIRIYISPDSNLTVMGIPRRTKYCLIALSQVNHPPIDTDRIVTFEKTKSVVNIRTA